MDCANTPGCVGINLDPAFGGGQCTLSMSDGETVSLPDYYKFRDFAGKGAVDHGKGIGYNFKCYVNPGYQ